MLGAGGRLCQLNPAGFSVKEGWHSRETEGLARGNCRHAQGQKLSIISSTGYRTYLSDTELSERQITLHLSPNSTDHFTDLDRWEHC